MEYSSVTQFRITIKDWLLFSLYTFQHLTKVRYIIDP